MCLQFSTKWNSFTKVADDFRNATDIKKMISLIFSQLDAVHGKIFTGRALGLITAAKEGLSASELEDIISCDEEVLSSIYEVRKIKFGS